MRFFLYFSLPLLLILDSFVSIDAAPQSVFKPVPPWSTHKQRLKRSIDDSTSTADYDGLSLDQLTKLLDEKKKDLEAANKNLIAKQAEYDKAKEDYDKKKEEWDKFEEFNYWRNKSAEAKKIIDAIDIPPLQEKYLESERYFLEAETMYNIYKEELEDINGLSEGKDVEKNLKDESTRLTQEIATQANTVTSMEGIKKTKETALSNLKDDEKYYNRTYAKYKCNEPEKATVTDCSDTIAELGKIKSKIQTAVDEVATAIQNHKVADDKKNELESQKNRIGVRLRKLGSDKTNITKNKEVAEINLRKAESEKVYQEKQYHEAKTAFETAKAELAKAVEAKTEADSKLNPDTEAKESEANTAQDKAGKEKTRLEGELAGLKADKDEKEKIWNATSAKVAEMAETAKTSAVSTGGSNLMAIIIPIVVVIIIGGFGAAGFMFHKKRKRLAKQAKVSHDSGDAAPAAPAAPPEAPEVPAPGADSLKPPSDASAAAPQPGSAKSNETPLAIDAPPVVKAIGAPPVVNAIGASPVVKAIGAPPVVKAIGAPPALKAIEAAPVATVATNKRAPAAHVVNEKANVELTGRLYCSKMKPYGEFGTFIKTVKNVKHKQELIEAANPGTMVYQVNGNFAMNLENETGNIILSIAKQYMKHAQNARKGHFYNGVYSLEGKTNRHLVLQGANPEGCQTLKTDARNNCTVFTLNKSRPTPQEQYEAKNTTKDRMSHWMHLFYEKKYTKDGKRAGAGHEEMDAATMKKVAHENLEGLSVEERKKFRNDAMREHWEEIRLTGCSECGVQCPRFEEPPSLISHYQHEGMEWFYSFVDWCSSWMCWGGEEEEDFDDTESCALDEQVDDWDENCKEMPSYMSFSDSDYVSGSDEEDLGGRGGMMSTEVGSGSDDVRSRSSAGGEDRSNSEGKKKKRKRKREKEKHMTRQDKKKEANPSYSSKVEKKKEEKKKRKEEKKKEEEGKVTNVRKEEKKKEEEGKVTNVRKEEKKKEEEGKIQLDSYSETTTSSSDSVPRSPPPNWQDEPRPLAKCHGQTFMLWDYMKRPSIRRLIFDKYNKKRVMMSMKSCDELIRRIEMAAESGVQLNYNSELILNVLASFKKAIKNDEKYIEIIEGKHSVRIGDIHGAMDTVTRAFKQFGGVGSKEWLRTRFIFLGDYVNRGKQSLDVMLYIMALRIRYPNNIVALRGNHEIYSVNVVYGFYQECLERIKDREGTEKYQEGKDIHFYFNYVFGLMSIIGQHNKTIQCHGGLPRNIPLNLKDMNKIMLRWMFEPKDCCPFANDLLWNDPMDCIEGFRYDKNRKAYVLGSNMLLKFFEDHPEIQMWVRGHQVVYNGSEFFTGMKMVSIFGTTSYDLTTHDNHGSILVVTPNNDFYFIYFVGFELEDDEVFEGKIVDEWVGKTTEEHNFYNMNPNMKADVSAIEPSEEDAYRTPLRKGERSERAEPDDNCPSETLQM